VWQTIFEAGTALGAIGAAVVAAVALLYFRRQADAMAKSLTATREQMTAQQEHWEADRRRVQRREHDAVRPALTFRLRARFLRSHDIEAFIDFRDGEAVRYVTVSLRVEGRELMGACVPDLWPVIHVGSHASFSVRASDLSPGDRPVLYLTYLDDLGGSVKWHQPLVVTQTGTLLGLEPDGELAPITTDDLP
jgi:hypothetical protein